jgi:D-glycero-D-manno-heptose 1,7-bisphosphate phosphatase
MTKLAILAPEGVVVEGGTVDGPLREWVAMPGTLEAIGRLNQQGLRVVLAFNEPALASGDLTPKALNVRHRRFRNRLARAGAHLDGIVFCPHPGDGQCRCHLPDTGLFVDLLRRFSVTAPDAVVIAQDGAHLAAGRSLGCRLMRIAAGAARMATDDAVWPDLPSAVEALLQHAAPPLRT